MELSLSNLVRTMQSKFRIGNITVKDSSGSVSFRNATDASDVGIIASTAKFTTSPASGYVWTSDASGNGSWAVVAFNDPLWFGDGSDGDSSLSSGTTTLTDDKYYHNLTLSGTAKITTSGYRIFVSGTLDITAAAADAISWGGGNGGNGGTGGAGAGTLGAGHTAQVLAGGQAGTAGAAGKAAAGGAGLNSNDITVSNPCMGGIISSGGVGGNTSTSIAGGNPGGYNGPVQRHAIRRYETYLARAASLITGGGGASGGGGGGATGAAASGGGGGGGAGGGVVWIAAKTINRGGSTAAGAISAKGGTGGNGGNAGASTAGDGGGGGGGNGGWIFLIYQTLTGSTATSAISVAGGTGGNAGSVGTGGSIPAGGGLGGTGGRITTLNMATSTVTETFGTGGASATGRTGGGGEATVANI